MTVEPASAAPAGEPSPVVPAGAAGYDLVDFHVPDETAALIKELGPATNWRNAGHLNRNGATIYSRWLAREIARLGVLAK